MNLLPRHPRRFGFIGFNIAALALLAVCIAVTIHSQELGIAGLPNFALGATGIVVCVVALVAGWIAWGIMLYRYHQRHPLPQ